MTCMLDMLSMHVMGRSWWHAYRVGLLNAKVLARGTEFKSGERAQHEAMKVSCELIAWALRNTMYIQIFLHPACRPTHCENQSILLYTVLEIYSHWETLID